MKTPHWPHGYADFDSSGRDVRRELEAQAAARGVGLATLLRDLATAAARDARRRRIRAASEAVGIAVAESAERRAFYDAWGTPDAG